MPPKGHFYLTKTISNTVDGKNPANHLGSINTISTLVVGKTQFGNSSWITLKWIYPSTDSD